MNDFYNKRGSNECQVQQRRLQQHRFLNIEQDLRAALRQPDDNFTLHYQPRVELVTGNVFSVEALIRWHHADLGNIPPDQFIPLAEDIGLIEQIDEWVLAAACQKTLQWRKIGADVRIGINVSGRSFNQRYFVRDVVKPLLKKYGIDGRSLEIEITEGVLLLDTQRIFDHIEALQALGIDVAIDDFGTGFSSLSYLNRFSADTLKIDGSFICDRYGSKTQKVLLKTIITLGKALGMKVVAECVETAAQQQYLLSLGCDEGQGFYWDHHYWVLPQENAAIQMVKSKGFLFYCITLFTSNN